MNVKNLIDLYTDFLIYNDTYATSTKLSSVLDGKISHDKFTRMLASDTLTSAYLWQQSKVFCTEIRAGKSVLILDDSIEQKRYSKCNGLIGYHFDHTENRSVRGINFWTALYHSQDMSIPVGVDFIEKKEKYIDAKTGKEKYRSKISKNERYRNLILHSSQNLNFDYVLNDSWFCKVENMKFIGNNCKRNFIMAMKGNRKVALSLEDKNKGKYVSIKTIELERCVRSVYVKGVDFPILITKQVFKNHGGVTGVLYLTSNDLTLAYDQITTIYKKRWKVEEYHKSIKSNTSFAQSPTKKATTQKAHFIASILAFLKLERLKRRLDTNHFALKAQIQVYACKQALKSYQQFNYKNSIYEQIAA